MEPFNLQDHSHRRLNILTGEWVLVSPHRAKRPWNGKTEPVSPDAKPHYDPGCYLCPGNTRASGDVNPRYTDTYIFQNDFSALLPDTPDGETDLDGLLVARAERGICRVINFTPDHSLTMAEMSVPALRKVVDLWAEQYTELGALDWIRHVQIFENKGGIMGNSNPHPHGQIWAQNSIPAEPAKKTARQKDYFDRTGRHLLTDYIEKELTLGERIIACDDHFVLLVPFWATWPFETMIVPRRHVSDVAHLSGEERDSFAQMLKTITVKYDNLFQCPFPYSAGIHQSPTDGPHPEWQMHYSFYPPLLRSATVKKFMVGYEMFADPQRDITAETAAERLRSLSDIHYKIKKP